MREKVIIRDTEDSVAYMSRLENMISSGELNSLKAIKSYIFDTFDIVNSNYLYREFYSGHALAYYIIHCEAENIVPVSGYNRGVL